MKRSLTPIVVVLALSVALAVPLLAAGPGALFAQEPACRPEATIVSRVVAAGRETVLPGERFVTIWHLRNTGGCAWETTFVLDFLDGAPLGGWAALPRAVPPGEQEDLTVNMQAPAPPGVYTARWQMRDGAGQPFGPPLDVKVEVVGLGAPAATAPPAAALTATPPPAAAPPAAAPPAAAPSAEQGDAWAELVVPGPATPAPVEPSLLGPPSSKQGAPGGTGFGNPNPPAGRFAFTVYEPALAPAPCLLYVANADGSNRRLLAQGACQPHMRSDGLILARGSDSLFLINSVTGQKQSVSLFGNDIRPSWSRQGGSFVYTNGIGHSLIVQDWPRRDGVRTTLTFGAPALSGVTPAWLPDGRIVYNGCNVWKNSGSCGLYVTARSSAAPVQITTDPTDMSPDGFGDQVVFMSARDGNWEVYRTGFGGGDVVRLTDGPAADGLPVWSPDGGSIAFVSNRDGGWAIWRMNPDGSGPHKLFDLGGQPGAEWTEERISWAGE